jgi:hypothetical protein
MLFFMTKFRPYIFALLLAATLTGCTHDVPARMKLAATIAKDHLPLHDILPAERFHLVTFARVTDERAPLRIYIEGDGFAWEDRHTPSLNPTPTDPIGLRLAALDPAPNVIWLSRPCQYDGFSEDCGMEYWTSKRFAPEVIFAYDEALDALKAKYHAGGLELIGFSGGGTVATLIAERRHDVLNLRTVAGNLDVETFNRVHNVSAMPMSLNPADNAKVTASLPQRHFTGGKDDIVTETVFDSYAEAEGNTPCLNHTIVKKAGHEDGWEEAWPQLLALPVTCGK